MRLVVGRVGRAHGIRGEVSVDVRTDEPDVRFAPGASLLTEPETVGPLTVTASRWHSGRLLVAFAGVPDRSAVEALRGTLLVVDVDDAAVPDEPDTYYDHQLVGLRVLLADGGALVGQVADVLHLPGQDVLAVTRPDGSEALLPFVAQIVPTVDLAAGQLLVAPPQGLLDATDAHAG